MRVRSMVLGLLIAMCLLGATTRTDASATLDIQQCAEEWYWEMDQQWLDRMGDPENDTEWGWWWEWMFSLPEEIGFYHCGFDEIYWIKMFHLANHPYGSNQAAFNGLWGDLYWLAFP